MIRTATLALAAAALLVPPLHAQDAGRSLDLTVGDVGVSIGDSRRTVGLRLNFRDRAMEEVIGANVTVWTPYETRGAVRGLALGVPVTGARRIDGAGVALLGLGAEESIRGVALAPLGIGAGREMRGIAVGGIGLGAGDGLTGIGVGGVGVGVGGSVRGIAVGGVGAGVERSVTGLAAGGVGVGVGENVTGIVIGGIGAGVGGKVRGISIGGIGVGAGEGATGVQVAGVGIGSGGTLRGIAVAGVGIGSERIEGLAVAAGVGAEQVRGVVLAPAYFRLADGGRMHGVNVSAYNDVRGTQRGLAIGIFNYARELDGVQVGLLNYAGNKPRGTRLLPLVNYARTR